MTLAHRFSNVTALRFEALFWRQAFPGLESSYLLAEDLRTFKTAGLNVRWITKYICVGSWSHTSKAITPNHIRVHIPVSTTSQLIFIYPSNNDLFSKFYQNNIIIDEAGWKIWKSHTLAAERPYEHTYHSFLRRLNGRYHFFVQPRCCIPLFNFFLHAQAPPGIQHTERP